MVLERWDPFNEHRRTDYRLSRLWRGFNGRGFAEADARWPVPLDVVQHGDDIVIRATLPGVKPEDIQVSIEKDLLTIRAQTDEGHEVNGDGYLIRERRSGAFHRSLRLPDSVDTDKVDTRYEQGVLTITFPKLEARKAKRLEIKVS